MNHGNWRRVLDHFTKLSCKACGEVFDEESVKIDKEVTDAVSVKITCTHCKGYVSHALVAFQKKGRKKI